MFRLLLLIALILHITAHSQVDPKKIDSLRRSVDSHQKAFKAHQDSFLKRQDSLRSLQIKEETERMTNNTIRFVQNREKEEKRKAMRYIFIGVGFLVLLIVGLLRRRKRSDKNSPKSL